MTSYIPGFLRRTSVENPLMRTCGQYKIAVTKTGKANQGVISALSNMWEKTKGVADLFGILKNSSSLAAPFVPARWADWNEKIGSGTGDARGWLSVPYSLTTIKRYYESEDYRDGLEAVAISSFATANFLGRALAKTIGSFGSSAKTALDAVDCKRACDSYQCYSRLSVEAEKPGSKASNEVRTGLKDLVRETAYKTAKYFLSFMAGLASLASFAFGVVLSPPIALAALVASLGSALLSFAADYSHEMSPWHARVTFLATTA